MKRNLLYLVIFFALTFILNTDHLYAQTNPDSIQSPTPSQKAVVLAQKLQRELNLSGPQYEETLKILGEKFEASSKSALNEGTSMNYNKQVEDLLNEDQKKLLAQYREERKKHKQEFAKKNPNYKYSKSDEELVF